MKELVSIITPAYNVEKTINATIDSVIAQTYQNWELLIIDDCSTDSTANIIKQYLLRDSRIHLLKTEKNSGVSVSRNLALSVANGRYIAFLDSDDLWLPQKLDKQISFMNGRNIAFSYTSYEIIDASGNKLHKYIRSKPIMTHEDVIKNTLIGCLTVVIDRAKTGNFEMPIIKHTEDSMTWFNILKRGYIAYGMPEVLSQYRVSSASMTSNKICAAKLQWNTYRDYCKYGIIKSTYYFILYTYHAITKQRRKV